MATENISIEITDKISPAIAEKLSKISSVAKDADASVKTLQSSLSKISDGAGLSNLQSELAKTASSQHALQTAMTQGQAAAQQLSAATIGVATAQTKGLTAAQQLSAATIGVATAQTRAATAQTKGLTAAQHLATSQQQAATEIINAAAAADKAALAALRLAQAHQQAATSAKSAGISVASFARSAAGLVGLGLSAGGVLDLAEAYTEVQNRLRAVTVSQGDLNSLTQQTFEVANRTRGSFTETATAVQRFDSSLRNLGKTQADTLRMTETINKLFKIGGSSASEQAGALLQLSQAFNSNVLAGEEFRSISENMPKDVRMAIAEVLGVNESALKKLASEGKITGEVMFKAFSSLEQFADSKFAELMPTLSDSLQVLKNNAIQTFGELDKRLGITAGLSSILLVLANNMRAVALAATVMGTALLIAVGPALMGALSAATGAVAAFGIALAANPVGLLIIATTAAVAAFALFSAEIKVSEDGLLSLQDVAASTWSFITDGAKSATTTIAGYWSVMTDMLKDKSSGLSIDFDKIMTALPRRVALIANATIGFLVGAYDAVISGWGLFPAAMRDIFAKALNYTIDITQKMINAVLSGINKIASLVNSGSEKVGLGRVFDTGLALSLDTYKMEVTGAASQLSSTVSAAFSKSMARDFVGEGMAAVGKIGKAITDRARDMKASRLAAEADAAAAGRGGRGGANVPTTVASEINTGGGGGGGIGGGKGGEFEKLTETQKAYARILEETQGPLIAHNATLEATGQLLAKNLITQEQATQQVTRSTEAYRAANDPLYEYNKQLAQERDLLKLLPADRAVEAQLMQVKNQLMRDGIDLSAKENEGRLTALRSEIAENERLLVVMREKDSLLASGPGARNDFSTKVTAVSELSSNPASGFGSGDKAAAANDMMQGIGVDTQFMQSNLDAQLSVVQGHEDKLKQMRDAKLISEKEYASASTQIELQRQNVYLNSASSMFGSLVGLQKSGNKKMADVGKASAIAQATIQMYTAATGAYASMSSIPYVGPALGAAAAAAAIAAGLANISSIRSQSAGFMTGGYTGNKAANEVAGVVHGREYVMDAAATSRIGVSNLKALQSGAAGVQRNGASAGTASPANAPAAAPAAAPVVNTSVSAIIVSSKEQAMASLKSTEGRAFIIETIEQNRSVVAKIMGAA